MNKSRNIVLLTVVMVAVLWIFWELRIHANAPRFGGTGPDVIVGDLPNIFYWGTSDGETAFSISTTSCNIGDEELAWVANTNQHPVISQNLYRVKSGRIEQLGQSWLKHGFFAVSQSLCGSCSPTDGNSLGVGCSDPYGAFLNGDQDGLGPKSEVNVATGFFPYPPRRLTSSQRGILDGRIRVANSDLDPAQNPGARYFIESQYVHPEDAAAGNKNNNVSYREVFVSTDPLDLEIDPSPGNPFQTIRMLPAIHAWKAVNSNVRILNVDVPGDGRIVVGIRSYAYPAGGFHNIFAIANQTSDRSVQSLAVNFDSGNVGFPGFNDVDYQYEPYSGTDWTPSINGSEIEWATQTFAQNSNANALRWGTLYTFSCNSDERPQELTLGLFKSPEDIVLDVSGTVLPDSYERTAGIYVSGGLADLLESDDSDLTIRNFGAGSVEFEIKGVSPVANPSAFEVTFEASTSPLLSNVDQTIELYDYDDESWVEVDVRRAARINDDVVTVAATGDLSRFVENGTDCVEARVRFKSVNPRRRFVSDSDQFKWTIFP
jgi:hypothetical protein